MDEQTVTIYIFIAVLALWLVGAFIYKEIQMSDLNDAIQSLSGEVDALEARVTEHEKADADAIASLNATIAALQAATPDVTKAVADLNALAAKIKAFNA